MDKKLNIEQTKFNELYVITPKSFQDERGKFTRLFCNKELSDFFQFNIKQINHSLNKQKGTIRGMHFQNPPYCEAKVIQCLKGSIYDVVVDLRKDSSTFLKHFAITLSEKNQKMLYIPKGFAHGFQTLQDSSEVLYFHDSYYTPNSEGALNIKDPSLNIQWPLPLSELSHKDSNHPFIDKNFKGIKSHEL